MRFLQVLLNLLKRQAIFKIYGLRRLGQAEQIVATGGKFVTANSGPLSGRRGMCWAKPPKKKTRRFRRAGRRKPTGWPVHRPSGLNSGNLTRLQLIDPPRTL